MERGTQRIQFVESLQFPEEKPFPVWLASSPLSLHVHMGYTLGIVEGGRKRDAIESFDAVTCTTTYEAS